MELVIEKINQLKGNISVPGDKSISHRSLILGSIAQGETRIYNFLNSLDCLKTFECMQSLGAEIELGEDNFIKIKGKGLYGLQEPKDMLEVGNSGTTIRLLAGLLSGQNFYSVLNGDNSIRKRPMKRVVQPLRLMGADATGEDNKVEEKTNFKVILKEIGPNKIKVIKEIRTFTALGLKESKDLVESAPNTVKENVDKKEAEGIKEKLEAVGAVVEIK